MRVRMTRQVRHGLLANPVAAGSTVGLTLMLLGGVCAGDYRHANAILGGIGQGTFTAMAADGPDGRLRTWGEWTSAAALGGGLNLALHPFFNGFGGKQGFTACLSCLPFVALHEAQQRWQLRRLKRQQHERRATSTAPASANGVIVEVRPTGH